MYLFFTEIVSSIHPEIPVKILPGDNILTTFTFLFCLPEPNSQLTMRDYVSNWTTPSGETFTYLVPNPPGFERYRIFQGPFGVDQNVQREATLLFIEMLSYQDAGNYTCEVRSSVSTQSPWFSASVELQLEGEDTCIHLNDPVQLVLYISFSELAGHCEQSDCTHQ